MSATLDTRSFAALGFAEEVCARPALLAMFAEHFDADADATLVLATRDVEQVEHPLLEAAATVGLDAATLPDLLVLPLGELDEQMSSRLAAAVDAVVSEMPLAGPLGKLHRYGIGAGALLREHAERVGAALALATRIPAPSVNHANGGGAPLPVATELVRKLLADHGAFHVVAIGADAIATARALGTDAHLIGFGAGAAVSAARAAHPAHTWLEWQPGDGRPLPGLPPAVIRRAIVLAGPVLPVDPHPAFLLAPLRELVDAAPVTVLLDTSGRDRLAELEAALAAAGTRPTFAGRTHHGSTARDALVAIVERPGDRDIRPAPDEFRVTALMSAYNEADIVEKSVLKLIADGLHVHLVDNWSTDDTLDRVLALDLGDRLTVERFPAEGPSPTFDLAPLLRNLERVASRIHEGWIVYLDVDETRRPPWRGVSLRDALHHVQRRGYNAVDHVVMRFEPVDDSFRPGDDFERVLRWFELERATNLHVKAWDARVGPVDLAGTGGHAARFPGRRVFPWRFALQHYPLRSQAHAERKLFRDRRSRWNPEERARGWHYHYDRHRPGASFLRDPADLLHLDAGFLGDYVLERVAGVGIGEGLPSRP